MKRLWTMFRRDETGAVVVEFALVVPFFFLMVFAIIDFSRAYYLMNTINSALREGARYGSTLKATTDGTSLVAGSVDQIKKRVYDHSASFFSPIDTTLVNVTLVASKTVTVGVTNYPFTFITPLPRTVGAGLVQISRTASFRWERGDPSLPP